MNRIEKNLRDIDNIGFRFFRERIGVNRDGDIHLNRLLNLVFIHRDGCNIVHVSSIRDIDNFRNMYFADH